MTLPSNPESGGKGRSSRKEAAAAQAAEYLRQTGPRHALYSRWHVLGPGRVTRELMPSLIVKRMPDGYAVKDSPEDVAAEQEARQRSGTQERRPPPHPSQAYLTRRTRIRPLR